MVNSRRFSIRMHRPEPSYVTCSRLIAPFTRRTSVAAATAWLRSSCQEILW